jgi:hypothetical protein
MKCVCAVIRDSNSVTEFSPPVFADHPLRQPLPRVDGEVALQVGQRERLFPGCDVHQPVRRVLNFPI